MSDPNWPRVVVYSTHDCVDCQRSKSLLRRLNVPYEEIYVDDDQVATAEVIRLNNGRRTLPTIIIDGTVVLGEPSDSELRSALYEAVLPSS